MEQIQKEYFDKMNLNSIQDKDSKKDANENYISNTDIYFFLENQIKEMLNINVIKIFKAMFSKLSEIEKKYFNENYEFNEIPKVSWVFNVNNKTSKYNSQGDISSSSLQKFFHSVFREINNLNNPETNSRLIQITKLNDDISTINSELCKFKNSFVELFNVNLILSLTEDKLILENCNLNECITKIEIKNGYLNVFLKGKGKTIVDEMKLQSKRDKTKSKEGEDENQYVFNALGHIESCFPEKFSVPRQGNLLELTRAKIILNKNVDISSFDGIESFDYIWIVYVFHLNTGFCKSKISPPKYTDGKKLGVFATRSPHRFNPIGLTLAKFEKIEKNEIFISSVDMISGTPVLDVKPYHHLESIDMSLAKYPDWIKQAQVDEEKKANVIFTDTFNITLKNILENHKLTFYDNFQDIINLIKGVLEIDPHSKYTQKKKDNLLYAFYIDKLNVIYEYNAMSKEVIIQNVEFSEEYKKLRNKAWLDNYNKNSSD